MKQKKYISPAVEIVELSTQDIVTTSFALDNEGYFDSENWSEYL